MKSKLAALIIIITVLLEKNPFTYATASNATHFNIDYYELTEEIDVVGNLLYTRGEVFEILRLKILLFRFDERKGLEIKIREAEADISRASLSPSVTMSAIGVKRFPLTRSLPCFITYMAW